LAKKLIQVFRNARICILALVYITFIGSMLIANDMALLTFLPLGTYVMTATGKGKYMAFTFIMQNIAANLGGMLTPFGNPQNLYLYTKFQIPTMEFMGIMAAPFALSILLITLCCIFFVKPEPLARACEVFNRYGAVTTFVCRLVPVIRQLISIPAGISRMPFLSFTFFTGLGAGIWTAVLAFVGFAIGRSAGDISYVELVNRGKAAATANLPLVIASAVALVASYILVSKLVMGRNARKG
jgi:Na+/H+ antiporter NhaD/arsenite permease-like protein